MSAIFKRELRSYFGSMYGYIYLAFTLCVIGVYVAMTNLLGSTAEMSYTFADMAFMSIFLIPILTMRSFALIILGIASLVVLMNGHNAGGEAGHLGGVLMGAIIMMLWKYRITRYNR